MKKWYQWFYLSIIFAVGGIINYLNDKQIIAAIIQVGITFILAFTQFICEKKGERGKKAFKYISIAILFLLIVLEGYLIFSFLNK